MFVVLSKFTVAGGLTMTAGVKRAFANRPHLVENAPGFIRLDVLSPHDTPAELWLLTYWTDGDRFRQWYRSHQYQAVHQEMPSPLKLVPGDTSLRFFEHITD